METTKMHVTTCKEEQKLSYHKFYERGLCDIPTEKMAILNGEPLKPGKGILFEDKDDFLIEKGDYCRIGFGENADGTAYAANETFVPGGTVEMMDFWIPWCGSGSDLRFKVWDPEDHYYTRSNNQARLIDPNIPMNERLWGTSNMVLEDIGSGSLWATPLNFMSPTTFGFNPALIGKDKCRSIVCGGGGPVVVVHKYYETDGGLMINSYFWVGWGCDNRCDIQKADLSKMPVKTVLMAKLLYGHSIREMTNLAAVMPEVFAEEKDNI